MGWLVGSVSLEEGERRALGRRPGERGPGAGDGIAGPARPCGPISFDGTSTLTSSQPTKTQLSSLHLISPLSLNLLHPPYRTTLMGSAVSWVQDAFPPKAEWGIDDIPDLTGKVIIVTGTFSRINNYMLAQVLNAVFVHRW